MGVGKHLHKHRARFFHRVRRSEVEKVVIVEGHRAISFAQRAEQAVKVIYWAQMGDLDQPLVCQNGEATASEVDLLLSVAVGQVGQHVGVVSPRRCHFLDLELAHGHQVTGRLSRGFGPFD